MLETKDLFDLRYTRAADYLRQFDRPWQALEGIEALIREIEAENACLRVADLAINGHDLMALGYTGRAIGETLNTLLEEVLEERLPNEGPALLAYLTKKEEQL